MVEGVSKSKLSLSQSWHVSFVVLKLKYVKIIWQTDTWAVLRPADDRNPAESFQTLKLLLW